MKKKIKLTYYIAAMLLCPAITFYLLEWMTHNPFQTTRIPLQLFNILFFELFMTLLFFLTGRLHLALMIETGIFAVIGLADYFVLQFRSAPIMPWDLFSLKTAASVADNYSYRLSTRTVWVLLCFALLLFSEWFASWKLSMKLRMRLLPAAASVLLLFGYIQYLYQDSTISSLRIYDKLFTPTTMLQKDGTVVAFLLETKYVFVEKPDGYSAEKTAEQLASYAATASSEMDPSDTDSAADESPNIIVIMNEAFSDPAILGDFETNEDYMPFLHRMMNGAENTITGMLNVSVLGGNTPNTEFEYLTGNSLAFLPQGSIPYQQYIKTETPSMASYLRSLGYQTIAMHPYKSTGWDRNQAYPLLGFDEMYFQEAFTNPQLVRNYISDQSNYDKIIQLYEQKDTDTPLFLFNVTMQNHSSYTEAFANFTPDITLTEGNTDNISAYLSLIKLSDQALENLVDYFSGQEEHTILVFFGDHQPTNSVIEPILKLNGKSSGTLTEEEEYLRYQVPYMIWANYDIEEASGLETSANYLGMHTLQAAGLPLSDYDTFLSEFEAGFPVINALHAVDDQDISYTIKEKKQELLSYAQLQYYQLFDRNQ